MPGAAWRRAPRSVTPEQPEGIADGRRRSVGGRPAPASLAAMATTERRTAAQLPRARLAAAGYESACSVPGEETMAIPDALKDHTSVRHITTRHEQGAAFMADVYGRLTGRAAVAMGTLGPGA